MQSPYLGHILLSIINGYQACVLAGQNFPQKDQRLFESLGWAQVRRGKLDLLQDLATLASQAVVEHLLRQDVHLFQSSQKGCFSLYHLSGEKNDEKNLKLFMS